MVKNEIISTGLWRPCVKWTNHQDGYSLDIHTQKCFTSNVFFYDQYFPVSHYKANNKLTATKVLASISVLWPAIVLGVASMMMMAGKIKEKQTKPIVFAISAVFLCQLATMVLFVNYFSNDFREAVLEVIIVYNVPIKIELSWQFVFGWTCETALTAINANVLIRFSKD